MANPTTTHVIEIETGIGEPAFIPLSMGHELQPISVGKKGMWRIESPRVLDVHAFVYFDGNSLFLQSADEANAASVDGFRVGKAWTELHAPCKIEIGVARLRFRSLIAEDNPPARAPEPPPVQAPSGGPASAPGSRPRASVPAAGAAPPPATAQRMPAGQRPATGSAQPPAASNPPIAFPKADRPFKPGVFSSSPDIDESTRVAPLESTGAARMASGSNQRPGASGSAENVEGGRPDPRSIPTAGASPAMQSGPHGGTGMMQVQGPMAAGGMQPMGYGPQQGYDPNQPQQGYDPNQPPYGQQPYPNAGGSGSFGAMGPGAMPGPGMPQGPMGSLAPGGYGSMTPQGVQQPPPARGGMQDLVAKLKQNSIPKIVAGLLFIIGGVLYLAEDDDPPPKRRPVATLDAGGTSAAIGGSAAPPLVAPPVMPVQPVWPAGVPCPPPNWPPNTPLPCTPNGVTLQNDPSVRDGGRTPKEPGGSALPAGTKTLERQAVDYVAAGEMAKAAAAYEELVRRDPNNKVYAEAARILRAKLDAGAP